MCCINFPSLTNNVCIGRWKQELFARMCHPSQMLHNSQDFVQNHGSLVISILASSVMMWNCILPTMKWFRRNSKFCCSMGFVVIIPRRYPLEDQHAFGRHPGRISNLHWCLVSYYSTWGFCGFVLSRLETWTAPVTTGHSGHGCAMGYEGTSLPNLDA